MRNFWEMMRLFWKKRGTQEEATQDAGRRRSTFTGSYFFFWVGRWVHNFALLERKTWQPWRENLLMIFLLNAVAMNDSPSFNILHHLFAWHKSNIHKIVLINMSCQSIHTSYKATWQNPNLKCQNSCSRWRRRTGGINGISWFSWFSWTYPGV